MSRIYTRSGDLGETGLYHGPRVGKDSARIEACGELDELNAALGIVRTEPLPPLWDGWLLGIQRRLFDIGAELATPEPEKHGTRSVDKTHVEVLEREIDQLTESLPPLKQFILPGGCRAAATMHVARAICRRAERRLVRLVRESDQPISLVLLAYLNRLGDLLFVLARAANAASDKADVPWHAD